MDETNKVLEIIKNDAFLTILL